MKRYKVYVYNTVDKFWDCYEVLAEDPVDARNVAVQRLIDETGHGYQGEAGDLVVTEPVEGRVYGYGQKDYRGSNTEKKFAKWTGEKFVPCDKIGRVKEG